LKPESVNPKFGETFFDAEQKFSVSAVLRVYFNPDVGKPWVFWGNFRVEA